MNRLLPLAIGLVCTVGLAGLDVPAAQGAAGDIHRVTAERANLRAGPSNDAAVRGTLTSGAELIELRSEGNWIGVRVLETGEEGWIFSDLIQRVAATELGDEPATGPFAALSSGFDHLIQTVNRRLGYSMVEAVERADDTIRVTPTREWLVYGGRDSHLLAATAIHQMWKNHQDGRDVAVAILDDEGNEYIRIEDAETGPLVIVQEFSEPS
jgi:hypothetical protein